MQENENCFYCIDIRFGHKLLGYMVYITFVKEVFEFYWVLGLGSMSLAYLLTIASTMWLAYAYCAGMVNDRPYSR